MKATQPRSGDSIPRTARKAAHLARTLRRRADAAERAYYRLHNALERRIGLSLPDDPFLYDVLAMVDVTDDGVWLWRGRRNNKGLGTVRRPGDMVEISVVRYLAVAFGVVARDWNGMLYPGPTGARDVNPWHRTRRASARPYGNTRNPKTPAKATR